MTGFTTEGRSLMCVSAQSSVLGLVITLITVRLSA